MMRMKKFILLAVTLLVAGSVAFAQGLVKPDALKPGDKVITNQILRLRDGIRVTEKTAQTPSAAPAAETKTE